MNAVKQEAMILNTSVLGVISAVIRAMGSTIVKGTQVIDTSFNVAIHGVNAANHLAVAVEKRAEIYGQGMVRNGALAEREITLKHTQRLRALEQAELVTPPADIKPVKVKPTSTEKAKSTKAKTKVA